MRTKFHFILFSIFICVKCYAQEIQSPQNKNKALIGYQMQPIHMASRWAKEVNPTNALKEYPRPQLQRDNWQNLNGLWEYTITDSLSSFPTKFEGNILVPYPIESALSGVKKTLSPDKNLWYRRIIQLPIPKTKERIILNLGAVDWQATIFINKKIVGQHTGGYQSFSFDITDYLSEGSNEILVKVFDPSDRGLNPHGKQVLKPGNIYYTPSSGIWQTVWLEKVQSTHITHLKTTPDIDKGILNVSIKTTPIEHTSIVEITVLDNGKIISTEKKPVTETSTNLVLKLPNAKLWSPDDPFLYDLSIKIIAGNKKIDEVKSYFGMRKINIQKDEKGTDRIFLNNKYTYNLGILDQGFWPEGLYTAPTDEALSFDIKTIKSLGFNTIRKHIKIEPERWYYHADKIGVLVWQDFVNPPQGLPEGSRSIFEKEMQETVDQLYDHPCIVTWVLFNERWGAYDQQRLTEWVKKYDPSRIVNGHSGELLYVNEQLRAPSETPWISSDLTDIHSYPSPKNVPALPNKARVIGEFGGVGVSVPGHEWDDIQGWGYIQVTPLELRDQYTQMTQELKKLEAAGLSASIYTQPFDVEGEENGLLTYDREIIKIPVNVIRSINRELVSQTNGFALNSQFIIAADLDTNNNDNKYEELLNQYRNGARDSVFLRRLVLMAIRKKDQEKATLIGNTYIDGLTQPFSKENLPFIQNITRTSSDKGFEIFWKQPQKVDAVMGQKFALKKVKEVIEREDIDIYKANPNSVPNWDSIQQIVSTKYGSIGEEIVLGRRMIYYCYEANPKDWKNFGKYYVLYFKKALAHPEYYINNLTWSLFENVTDPQTLEFGAEVMKYAIDKWDQSPEAYDTYANLLHKTKQSEEAIKWEEKALQLTRGTPNEKVIAETLQKMKSGQPTWPTNN